MSKRLLPAAIAASLLLCAIGGASLVRGARDFYAYGFNRDRPAHEPCRVDCGLERDAR